ncbi:MAG: glycosyltransferase family 1 protein [Candidatus Gastranaerophilales bacterium]|nr:glycosyltransferase family 1 protein [Candidatus Gastranaerophilales bacterium]
MKKILGIMPHSIGGRLTTSSLLDGFSLNNYEVVVFDELKNDDFSKHLIDKYDYIVGYDFSPIKLKIDYNLKIPCVSYFSDVIQEKTSGVGYLEYQKYLKNEDIFVFYWDRTLAKKEGYFYQPHFVNTSVYKNYLKPEYDVLFAGRLDTDLRLNLYLELNKLLPDLKFKYCGIKRHFEDALLRCNNEDKKILKSTYFGFIDNEKDMARVINEAKIIYNINAQGVSSLNYRTIQTLACERLLISDSREELDLFKGLIPTYSNPQDLAQKIKYYLENIHEYQRITKKSREIIELNHDSFKCVKDMLDKINQA